MEINWHIQLDNITHELNALETCTEDGPILLDVLLRLIDVLHDIKPLAAGDKP